MLPSVEYLRECFTYDPESGVLTWKARPANHFQTSRSHKIWNTQFSGKPAGSMMKIGYLRLGLSMSGKVIHLLVHRIIFAMHTGAWPSEEVDHKNTIRSDNRIENLRSATCSENRRNSSPRKFTKTGFKGVSKSRDKFAAAITVDGRTIHLGMHKTAEDAFKAYQEASLVHHGAFARSS